MSILENERTPPTRHTFPRTALLTTRTPSMASRLLCQEAFVGSARFAKAQQLLICSPVCFKGMYEHGRREAKVKDG